ncbi:ATP-binding protein [Halomonas urmiana]|uniref:ATP-binding protein n=1 Tax=Halomonas urmiana TaxID=490901 RepID=UPI0019571663|nr:ATP-binding protein [Halomonas urmiana]
MTIADMLVEHERQQREVKRIDLYRRQAGFPSDKQLEAFDYRHKTTSTKRKVNALLDFAFLDNRKNQVFIGPLGVGKSHLAIGIGQMAIEAGCWVRFRVADLGNRVLGQYSGALYTAGAAFIA